MISDVFMILYISLYTEPYSTRSFCMKSSKHIINRSDTCLVVHVVHSICLIRSSTGKTCSSFAVIIIIVHTVCTALECPWWRHVGRCSGKTPDIRGKQGKLCCESTKSSLCVWRIASIRLWWKSSWSYLQSDYSERNKVYFFIFSFFILKSYYTINHLFCTVHIVTQSFAGMWYRDLFWSKLPAFAQANPLSLP